MHRAVTVQIESYLQDPPTPPLRVREKGPMLWHRSFCFGDNLGEGQGALPGKTACNATCAPILGA